MYFSDFDNYFLYVTGRGREVCVWRGGVGVIRARLKSYIWMATVFLFVFLIQVYATFTNKHARA